MKYKDGFPNSAFEASLMAEFIPISCIIMVVFFFSFLFISYSLDSELIKITSLSCGKLPSEALLCHNLTQDLCKHNQDFWGESDFLH